MIYYLLNYIADYCQYRSRPRLYSIYRSVGLEGLSKQDYIHTIANRLEGMLRQVNCLWASSKVEFNMNLGSLL